MTPNTLQCVEQPIAKERDWCRAWEALVVLSLLLLLLLLLLESLKVPFMKCKHDLV